MADTVLFPVRLAIEVNKCLRKRVNKRGELADLLIKVLENINLKTVEAIEPVSVRKESATSVKLPVKLHAKLKKVSGTRSLSMNAILNGAIKLYCQQFPCEDNTGEGETAAEEDGSSTPEHSIRTR